MNNNELEKLIKDSFNDFVPDVLDKVKASDTELFPEETKKSRKAKTVLKNKEYVPNVRKIAFALCVIVIMIFVSSGSMILAEADDSYIYVDINPSIQIVTKRNGDVKRVVMMNNDAEVMLKNISFKGKDVDEVIEIIVDRAIANGKIDRDLDNEILISVSNKNAKRKEAVLNKVYQKVDNQLAKQNIQRNISKQNVTKAEKENADKIKISAGKLILISKIIELDPTQKIEILRNKTIKELKAIYKELIEEHYTDEQEYENDNNNSKYNDDYKEYFKEELDEFIRKRKKGNN